MPGDFFDFVVGKDNKIKQVRIEEEEEFDDNNDKFSALKDAWQALSLEDKKLLEKFYYLDIPLNRIAEVENKSDVALRKQKQRAIEKLRQVFFTIYNNI
jgi:DNA-directed RNA polymerase specialized sigma subunit